MRSILIILVSVWTSVAFGQIDEVRRITKTLCSPEFHGRGYYKRGDRIAAEFLQKEFEKLGVKPVKKHDYLQPFNVEGVNTFPGKMAVEHNGKSLKPGIHYMVDPSSAGGTMTLNPAKLTAAELLGETAQALDIELIKSTLESLAAEGKNALLLDLSGITGDSLKTLRGFSAVMAENVPVIEVMDRKFTWSVGRKQLPNPLVFVQDSIYQEGQSFTIDMEAKFVDSYASQNVVAMIPAKKKCAKTIIFTAHYDHLGRMGDDTYFPGANDNASGTAMLITMAKYFMENPVDYNVMFIAFAGEEAGLVGSKYFTEFPMIKLKNVEFLLNLDIMGSGEDGITIVNATVFPEQFEMMQSINKEFELLKRVKKRGPAANSDHYWFTEKGVPSFFIYTMGPNKHYHDVFDEYEELSFVEYNDITTLLIKFVEHLSPKK